jgi:hypothetical protein
MPLTQDQQKGADAFFQFLFSPGKTFILSGGAGVGKTYLMTHLKNNMHKRYNEACALLGEPVKYQEAVFTATTNKAAEVLEKTINEPVTTIHTYLHLTVEENFKTGKTTIKRTNKWMPINNRIIFIDEASMIDSTLYAEILRTCLDCKIIFVGDHAQMAPVKEEISPIYSSVIKKNFVFLSEPIRNADSPALMDLCTQLRETVETGVFTPIKEIPGHIEYLDKRQMQNKIDTTFLPENADARILCYTNKRVQGYNEHIRQLRGKSSMLEPGDHMVVAQSYADRGITLSVEREVFVQSVDPQLLTYSFSVQDAHEPDLEYYQANVQAVGAPYSLQVNIAKDPLYLDSLLKRMAKQKLWQEYYITKGTFVDLRGKEACTVYKSQGSTYHTVFMDIGNIGTSFNPKQVARMLFVGASRATTKLYLFGKLPGKYNQTVNTTGGELNVESYQI